MRLHLESCFCVIVLNDIDDSFAAAAAAVDIYRILTSTRPKSANALKDKIEQEAFGLSKRYRT